MKPAGEVSAEKLRGGFYTPDALVRLCLRRVAALLRRERVRLLEPSAGDGAFVRGLPGSPLAGRVSSITAIEPMEIEASKAGRALGAADEVLTRSAIEWAATTTETYDAAVGNPPFVRYQFIPAADRRSALRLARRLGIDLGGVANLWIPVLLGALSRLRSGGAFAFVVPTECLTGCSAGVVRRWLIGHCDAVGVDVFPPGSFPGVLQEVAVLSGRVGRGRAAGRAMRLRIGGRSHEVVGDGPWTKYLLSPAQVGALDAAAASEHVVRLGSVATFEVSIVTGANDFFTASDDTVARFGLAPWARPLLPRIRHAPGLRYTAEDQVATRRAGARAWLLDFSESAPVEYIRIGESRRLHERYKCRIREPWYRVPGITSGELLLSKRSHLHPRVAVNDAGVFTTDTIYRGRTLDPRVAPEAVAAGFHSSLTLLSAEIEGRSFGGGVLELVPSEIGRLLFVPSPAPGDLARLDAVARADRSVIEATDEHLVRNGAIDADVLRVLSDARQLLQSRRLDRSRAALPLDDRPAA